VQEKVIEAYLRDNVKTLGGKAYKFVSPGTAGVPDRLVLLPNGKAVFIELKATGKKATALQEAQHRKIRNLNFEVFTIDRKTEVDKFIDHCREMLSQ